MHLDTITGEITSQKILGSDFFGRATVRLTKGSAMVVGKLLGVQEGDTVEVTGVWDENAKYGKQFKARTIKTVVPRDASGVVGWMQARLPNLGRARAQSIVERFGIEGVWDVIEREPDRLLEIDGITPARRDMIVSAYHEHRGERDRVVRFKSWGLTDGQIARVLGEWGARAEERIRENPYALAEHVHGFGFLRADTIARRMGLPADAPARIRAGLMHVLAEASERGHTFLWTPALVKMTAKLLGLANESVCSPELRALLEAGRIWADPVDRRRVALVELARAEEEVAARLLRLAGVTAETKAA
jgi:exodeoxyribonuclease V alpha subunit